LRYRAADDIVVVAWDVAVVWWCSNPYYCRVTLYVTIRSCAIMH